MDVMEAICTRRTIFKFKPEPVPNDVIEKIFEAGVWAPNHHLTEPWRFIVLGEKTKETLAQRYSEIQMAKASEAMEFERAAGLRDRIRALTQVQTTQGINPRSVSEADPAKARPLRSRCRRTDLRRPLRSGRRQRAVAAAGRNSIRDRAQ